MVATITTNLMGPIRMTSELIEHLKGKSDAVVANTSSVLGFVPLTATAVYSSTKAAVHSYIFSQAQVYRGRSDAIHVNRHPPDDGLVEAEIAACDGFWQCQTLGAGLWCTQAGDIGAPSAENADPVVIQTFQSQSRESTTRHSSHGGKLGERNRSCLGRELRARRRSRCEHPGQDRGRLADTVRRAMSGAIGQ
jgi:NAD(P)-dependent dehydrogenase (short-subunit alcohol dehydrogenase family)